VEEFVHNFCNRFNGLPGNAAYRPTTFAKIFLLAVMEFSLKRRTPNQAALLRVSDFSLSLKSF
jgi:hypothetical protein